MLNFVAPEDIKESVVVTIENETQINPFPVRATDVVLSTYEITWAYPT
jgi:hypothetical protein